jgi:hypothetical protein
LARVDPLDLWAETTHGDLCRILLWPYRSVRSGPRPPAGEQRRRDCSPELISDIRGEGIPATGGFDSEFIDSGYADDCVHRHGRHREMHVAATEEVKKGVGDATGGRGGPERLTGTTPRPDACTARIAITRL